MMECLLHVLVTRRAPAKCSSLLVVPAMRLLYSDGAARAGRHTARPVRQCRKELEFNDVTPKIKSTGNRPLAVSRVVQKIESKG